MKQTCGKRNEKKTLSNPKSWFLSLFCFKNLSIENKNKSLVSNGLSQLKNLFINCQSFKSKDQKSIRTQFNVNKQIVHIGLFRPRKDSIIYSCYVMIMQQFFITNWDQEERIIETCKEGTEGGIHVDKCGVEECRLLSPIFFLLVFKPFVHFVDYEQSLSFL